MPDGKQPLSDSTLRRVAAPFRVAQVGGAGGVAFSQTAQLAPGTKLIGAEYNSGAPDGRRIELRFIVLGNTQPVTATMDLYDWEAWPALEFVTSKFNACVSISGDSILGMYRVPSEAETVRYDRWPRKILYHRALENSLMGLRLLQADLLLIEKAAVTSLPTLDRKPLLGAGESVEPSWYNSEVGISRRVKVDDVMGRFGNPPPFHSYVITDWNQKVTASVKNRMLVIDGYPFWYVWRFSNFADLIEEFISLNLKADFNGLVASHGEAEARRRFSDEYIESRARSLKRYFELVYSKTATFKLESEEASSRRSIFRTGAGEIRFGTIVPRIEYLKSESELLSALMQKADGINSVVYRSLVRFMRSAAFFRLVSTIDDGATLNKLRGSIPNVDALPIVTPDGFQ